LNKVNLLPGAIAVVDATCCISWHPKKNGLEKNQDHFYFLLEIIYQISIYCLNKWHSRPILLQCEEVDYI
jgi:hypothetical protein